MLVYVKDPVQLMTENVPDAQWICPPRRILKSCVETFWDWCAHIPEDEGGRMHSKKGFAEAMRQPSGSQLK